jgi:hypothetical protein
MIKNKICIDVMMRHICGSICIVVRCIKLNYNKSKVINFTSNYMPIQNDASVKGDDDLNCRNRAL